MKNRKKNRIAIKNYLIILFMLFMTDTMLFGTNYNQELVSFAKLSVVIFCIAYIIFSLLKYRLIFYKKEILLLFIPIGFIISGMLINDFSMGMFLKMLLIVTGYYFAKNIHSNDFFEIFTKIMVFLAAYSLVFYVIFLKEVSFLNNILNILPELKRNVVHQNRFANLIFTNIPIDNVPARARNWGVFWEPGAYSVYLNIALAILLFAGVEIKNKKRAIYILIITIVTTFSTTGILAMILLLLGYLLKNNIESVRYKKHIRMILIILPIVIAINSEIAGKIFGKLSEGLSNVSFSSRWYSIIYNFEIFIDNISNFIFGIGTKSYDEAFRLIIMNELGESLGNTNTIMLILAQYGFYIGFLYIYLVWNFSKKLGNNEIVNLIIFVSMVVLLFMEDFTYSLFMNALFYFGLRFSNSNRSNLEKQKI